MVGALTTITDAFGRVSIHGLRQELLAAQLDAAGLTPMIVRIPYPCPNDIYEREMAAMDQAKAQGITRHLRRSVSRRRAGLPRRRDSSLLASRRCFQSGTSRRTLWQEMVASGVDARLVCVDLKKLPKSFAGRRFDAALLADHRRVLILRRERRVSFVRCGRTDAGPACGNQDWRRRRA